MVIGAVAIIGVILSLIGAFSGKWFLVLIGAICLIPGLGLSFLFSSLPWYIYAVVILLAVIMLTKK